jgi:hypothetical protein
MSSDVATRERHLRVAAVAFAVGSALHVIDHLRRGQGSITETLYVLGNAALVLQDATIVLVLTRHRVAPVVATGAGFGLAVGFAAAHWLPHWSAMSDPVWEIDSLTWFSYVASGLEVVGALAVGAAGIAVVKARGLETFAADPRRSQPTT